MVKSIEVLGAVFGRVPRIDFEHWLELPKGKASNHVVNCQLLVLCGLENISFEESCIILLEV